MSTVPSPPTHHRRLRWRALAGFIAMVSVVAFIGGLSVATRSEAHARFNRPSWALPGELYGPVWTVVYLLIAVAGWCYWRTDGETRGFAAYGVALLFNLLWTPLYFASGSLVLALADIILLDIAVLVTIVVFSRRSKLAAWLMGPYLLWLGFSTALNAAVVWLN